MENEKRLIDANAVLKKMQNWNTRERLINCVEDAPTVDAVEVCQCKECCYAKHYANIADRKTFVCKNLKSGFFDWIMADDDFCYYGERREGEWKK